jgi:bifunctional UDP-N-acetylglucosamine pyrophosphorylase/glucosamine-1-phosphate N-acetyltransferase
MLDLVLDAVLGAGVERPIVIANPDHREVVEHVRDRAEVVLQGDPKGTGDAVRRVAPDRLRGHEVVVVNGDMPLVTSATVKRLIEAGDAVTAVRAPDRQDGRIVRRPDGRLERIVEWKDAREEERRLEEVNAGLYAFDGDRLVDALAGLEPSPATGELYLTAAVQPGAAIVELDENEGIGVNDRHELVVAEHALTARKHQQLYAAGVTLRDSWSVFIDWDVEVAEDVEIEPFTILRGETRIGRGSVVGPYAHLTDTVVGEGCKIEHSRLDGCRIGDGTDCGPFVRIRPGTEIGEHVHVGSFAEINRTSIGAGSRVPHFSYLGDAVIGRNVNIAAGTITANYDGVAKHKTVIEDDVFVGVDTMLRAPVKLGKGSRTGAGAVVLDEVPPGETVVGVPARPVRKEGRHRS